MLRRSIDSHPAPPKPWHRNLLRESLIILGKIIFTIALVVVLPIVFIIWAATDNLSEAPPLGTEYVFERDAERQGYAAIWGTDSRNNRKKLWQPVCFVAAGGRMTLTSHLLIRKEVKDLAMILNGFYRTGTFVYTAPSQQPAEARELPWCHTGFEESVPFTKYMPQPLK